MSDNKRVPFQSVESILISSNFFLWAIVILLTDSGDNLFDYLIIVTLISLFVVIFSDLKGDVIIRKLILFFTVNSIGSLVLITNINTDIYENQEGDEFVFHFFLQITMISLILISLFIHKLLSSKKLENSSK